MFEALAQFKDQFHDRHEYAIAWKERTGGKVVGYFCTYAPEELLYAADILPVRLLGSHEQEDVTQKHIVPMYCPFCRDVLAQGLKGRYHYLDGIVMSQACMHLRQSFHSWRLHVPGIDFSYNLIVPQRVQSPRAVPCLTAELQGFKEALEAWTGHEMTEAALERGVDIMDANRRLLRRLYELRKADTPPVTGLDSLYAVLASQLTDKREHSALMRELLPELETYESDREPGLRLMIVGSEGDDPDFVEMAESLGSTVVIDEQCSGSRYFWNTLPVTEEDTMTRIARRYIMRPPCPSKDWPERRRFTHIMKLARDYDVDAVLLIQQKFCDPHELDIVPLRELLQAEGLPTYMFEFDMKLPIGQFKIRLEAFFETLVADSLPF